MILENIKYKFHHKEKKHNPTSKGINRLKKEKLEKTPQYGSYIEEENNNLTVTKTHKKNKERPRC